MVHFILVVVRIGDFWRHPTHSTACDRLIVLVF